MYSGYAKPEQRATNESIHNRTSIYRTVGTKGYSSEDSNIRITSLRESREDMGNSGSSKKINVRDVLPRRNSSPSNSVSCRDKRSNNFENEVDSSLPEIGCSKFSKRTTTSTGRRNSSDSGYNSSGKACETRRETNGFSNRFTYQLDLQRDNKSNSKRLQGDYRSDPSLWSCNKSEVYNRTGSKDSGRSSSRTSSDLDSTSITKPRPPVSDRSMSPKSPKSGSDGLVGLQNLGNTCFMNSILQCLSHCCPLRDKMLSSGSLRHNRSSKMKGNLVSAFAELIKTMWTRSRCHGVVSPSSFKTQIQRFSPRFVGYEQQDSQEFLRFLLEGLNEDLNEAVNPRRLSTRRSPDISELSEIQLSNHMWEQYKLRDNSLVTDLFCGQIKSTLTCTKCTHRSVTYDPFWDLSLPIPGRSYSYSSSRIAGSSVTLSDCLRLFTKKEELDGDEKPKCEECKTRQKCQKQIKIHRFPRILVIHLKRFSGFGYRSKLQTDVVFPLNNFDMSDFASESYTRDRDSPCVKYNLFAVSNHSGTAFGGHYTAYCKHPESKEWHSFNDSRVGVLSSSSVRGSQAYVLFYEKDES